MIDMHETCDRENGGCGTRFAVGMVKCPNCGRQLPEEESVNYNAPDPEAVDATFRDRDAEPVRDLSAPTDVDAPKTTEPTSDAPREEPQDVAELTATPKRK